MMMMNNSEIGHFPFNTFPMLTMSPFFKPNVAFDGMVTMMSQEVEMNAH